ncbi:hypothetical protein A7U61_00555 [Lactococcus lactis]|mgnify:FL=1|nr:hypothetical protein L3107_1039 [Lactococcus cremoris]EQC87855.1 hypothetical protein LLT1_07645 [Lactococcus cremoris subsp. cremoris TIFN1]OAJ97938.1 hypothetical protein A7U61_00555 [Lactococcus lactis]
MIVLEIFLYLLILLLLLLSCLLNKFDFTVYRGRFKIYFRITGLLYILSMLGIYFSQYLLTNLIILLLIFYLVIPYLLIAISFYLIVHYRKSWHNSNYWLSVLTLGLSIVIILIPELLVNFIGK